MRRLLPLIAVLALAAPAAAQRRGAQTGWREVLDPEQAEAQRHIQQGLALMMRALPGDDPALGDAPRWLTLDHALLRFERARRVLPNDPDLAFYTAWALSHWERPGRGLEPDRRDDEAIAAWHRLRRLAPDRNPGLVASQLAQLHTRRRQLDLAVGEYRRALTHAGVATVSLRNRTFLSTPIEGALAAMHRRPDRALLHGNLAEVLMLNGALAEAEQHYRNALRLGRATSTRALAEWGLALTLERAGEHERALEWAGRALRDNPIGPDTPALAELLRRFGPLAILHHSSVFFEPAHELHAYEALGQEALATREVDPDPWALEDALRSWRSFLTQGGVNSRFASQARRRIEALEPRVEALGERPAPRRRRPRL